MQRTENHTEVTLQWFASKQAIAQCLWLFGHGVSLNCLVGCTIRELLCRQFGIDADYLDNRIQTIFLNGKAADDVDKTRIAPNSVLALSAAMPGLAGATLRKGGHLSAMRSRISHTPASDSYCMTQGRITLKLFNLVQNELGPMFLAAGVGIPAAVFTSFAASFIETMGEPATQVKSNADPVRPEQLESITARAKTVFLSLSEP